MALSDWVPLNYSGTLPEHPWFWRGPKFHSRVAGIKPPCWEAWQASENWDPTLDTVFVNKKAFLRDPQKLLCVPNDFKILHGNATMALACPSVHAQELPWEVPLTNFECPFVPNLGSHHLTATSLQDGKRVVELIPIKSRADASGFVVYSSWEPVFMQQLFMHTQDGLLVAPAKHLGTWQRALSDAGISCHVYESMQDPLQRSLCRVHLAPPTSERSPCLPSSVACHVFQCVAYYAFTPDSHIVQPKTKRAVVLRPLGHCKINDMKLLLPWPGCLPVKESAMKLVLSKLAFELTQVPRMCKVTWHPTDHIQCRQLDLLVILWTMNNWRGAPTSVRARIQTQMEKLDACPVCKEDIPLNDVALFECGHILCGKCETKIEKQCPVCRCTTKRKHRRLLNFLPPPDHPDDILISSGTDRSFAEAISRANPTGDIHLLVRSDRSDFEAIKRKIQDRKDMMLFPPSIL